MYNQCTFIGPVVEKKMHETATGKPMLFFKVKTWDKQDRASFIDCTAYSAMAERIWEDFPEGRVIFLTCRAHNYKDKDGNQKTSFVVESFEYCSPKASA